MCDRFELEKEIYGFFGPIKGKEKFDVVVRALKREALRRGIEENVLLRAKMDYLIEELYEKQRLVWVIRREYDD